MAESDLVMQKQVQEEVSEDRVKKISLSDINTQKEAMVKMPDLKGMTYREVLKTLRGKDVRLQVNGKGKVSKTFPSSGKKLKPNSQIKVILK